MIFALCYIKIHHTHMNSWAANGTTGGVSSAYIITALQRKSSAGTVTITTGGLPVTGDVTITTGGVSSAWVCYRDVLIQSVSS
jgi:hypothetical protein